MSTANFAIVDYCSLISLNLTLALNHIHGDACRVPHVSLLRHGSGCPNPEQGQKTASSELLRR